MSDPMFGAEQSHVKEQPRDSREFGFGAVARSIARIASLARLYPWLMILGSVALLDFAFVFSNTTESKHDLAFHASNVHDFLTAWREGELYPRWSATSNHGLGSPTFVFYPPLAYAVAAMFGWLGCDVPTCLRLCFGVLGFARAAFMYLWLRGRRDTARFALWAALLYLLLPYPTVNVFRRGALAEVAAFVWFPLILWGCDELRNRWSLRLTLASAGLLVTHLLSMLMFGPIAALYFLWTAKTDRRIWLRGVASAAISLLLAAIFVVPAITELRHTAIPSENQNDGSFLGVYWNGSFLFDLGANDREWQLFNWTVSSVTMAQLACIWIAVGIVFTRNGESLWYRRLRRCLFCAAVLVLPMTIPLGECFPDWVDTRTTAILTSCAIGTTLVSAVVMIAVIVWDVIRERQLSFAQFLSAIVIGGSFMMTPMSSFLWSCISKLAAIQFPWRWNGVVSFAAAILIAAAVDHIQTSWQSLPRSLQKWDRKRICATTLLAIALGVLGLQTVWFCVAPSRVLCLLEDYATVLRHGRTNIDYIPAAGFHYFVRELPRFPERARLAAGDGEVTVKEWRSHDRRLEVSAIKPAVLTLHTFWFPGWTAMIDGSPTVSRPDASTGLMLLDIPAGRHEVRFRFENSSARKHAANLTFLGVLSCVVSLVPRVIRRRH